MNSKISVNGFCSIISCNYLAQVRTLAESLRKVGHQEKIYVLIVDWNSASLDLTQECFTPISLEQLHVEDARQMLKRYNVVEFCTAIKPFLIEYLFNSEKIEKIVYLDPDILVLMKLHELFDKLERSSVLLTPHVILSSQVSEAQEKELNFLQSGVFNLGFLGLKNNATGKRLLQWWGAHLKQHCCVDPARGLFVDQKWMDFAPIFFDETEILRDFGLNVSWWNSHERQLTKVDSRWFVNGVPLKFYHFSGFDADEPTFQSGKARDLTTKSNPALYELFQLYLSRLIDLGYHEFKKYKYGFGYRSDGSLITDYDRRAANNINTKKFNADSVVSSSVLKIFQRIVRSGIIYAIAKVLRKLLPAKVYNRISDLVLKIARLTAIDIHS